MAQPTDQDLLRRIATLDREALETLYDRHERPVFNFAMRMVNNATLAEEIVQDVFLKVWRSAGTYDAGFSQPSTWLLTICRNAAVDRLRRLRTQNEVTESELMERLAAENADVEHEAAQRLLGRDVHAALSSLPSEQREVIELMYFQGFSQTEIAARCHVPLGTVKGRARLALSKLREHLQSWREVETGGGQ